MSGNHFTAKKREAIHGVEEIIRYTFQDGSILWEALHVPGAPCYDIANRNLSDGNKRLALLGDAILKTVLIENWYGTLDARGQGNRHLSRIGGNANLADVGRRHGLDAFINPHPGQFGALGTGTVADTVEAILGAVWLDRSDSASVRAVMQTLGLA
ncbi:MAG: hypothetical protein Q9163_003792 [Psora crenata]